jgi:signal transduction histidine kinase
MVQINYDIIKAHDGELKVETKEGKFAEFLIHLPVI